MDSGVEFNDTQFDDILQAQWAVFFDAIGVKWEYRAYSLPLDSMRDYSPQFRIWIHGEDYWFEALPRLSFSAFSEICPCLSFAATLRDIEEADELPQAGGRYLVSFG